MDIDASPWPMAFNAGTMCLAKRRPPEESKAILPYSALWRLAWLSGFKEPDPPSMRGGGPQDNPVLHPMLNTTRQRILHVRSSDHLLHVVYSSSPDSRPNKAVCIQDKTQLLPNRHLSDQREARAQGRVTFFGMTVFF